MTPASKGEARHLGAVRYFTGKPCKAGHIAERLTKCGVCVECNRINVRRYELEHPERTKAKRRERYWKDAETHRAASLKWNKDNHERAMQRKKDWIKANPDRAKELDRQAVNKRRARRLAAPHTATRSDIQRIKEAQGGRCPYCKAPATVLDHKQPLSRGGGHVPSNLQWLCRPCNQRKHAKPSEVFAREVGLLL